MTRFGEQREEFVNLVAKPQNRLFYPWASKHTQKHNLIHASPSILLAWKVPESHSKDFLKKFP